MKHVAQAMKFWLLVAVVALLCSACSTDNNNVDQGQEEATKPPPQVRVELLPTNTPLPPTPTELVPTPTVEPTAVQVYIWPTPNEEELANQIESLMDEIDNKLKSQDTTIKP